MRRSRRWVALMDGLIVMLWSLALLMPTAPGVTQEPTTLPTPTPDPLMRSAEQVAAQISQIDPAATLVFGPQQDKIMGALPSVRTSLDTDLRPRDFLVGVSFGRAQSSDEQAWNYALFFRDDGTRAFGIVITSEGEWRHMFYNDGRESTLDSGDIPVFRLNLNQVIVHVNDDEGALYINGKLIAALDLAVHSEPGEIKLGAVRIRGQQVASGDETAFVLSLYDIQPTSRVAKPGEEEETTNTTSDNSEATPGERTVGTEKLIFGPGRGTLRYPRSGVTSRSVKARDFVLRVRIYNPTAIINTDWAHVLTFRMVRPQRGYALVLTAQRDWFLGEYKGREDFDIRDEGAAPSLNRDEDGFNDIELRVLGEVGEVFLNGEFATTLDVSSVIGEGAFSINVFAPEEDLPRNVTTRYERFTIHRLTGDVATTTTTAICTVRTDGSTALRIDPNSRGQRVALVPRNTAIDVEGVSADGQWLRVQYANLAGWVRADSVTGLEQCGELPVVE